jgi:hypothetical protein
MKKMILDHVRHTPCMILRVKMKRSPKKRDT